MTQTGGLFVTGTDTGVGKTRVACAVLSGLRAHGCDVGAMKPIETGVGTGGPADALALRAAAGVEDPIEDVCPQRFGLPAAPWAAARAAGAEVSLPAIRTAFARVTARHPFVVVEGAGGLLVPIAARFSMAELAAELGLPLLIVARARLGTIHHTLSTLEAAQRRALPVSGVVISHAEGPLSEPDALNLDLLRRDLGELLVGELPHLDPGVEPPADAIPLARWLRGPAR